MTSVDRVQKGMSEEMDQKTKLASAHSVTRRRCLQTAVVLGSACGADRNARAEDTGKEKPPATPNEPLGQDYVVVAHVPDNTFFVHDPALAILPDGDLIVAAPFWERNNDHRFVVVLRSGDGGASWTKVCEQPWSEATLFVHEGRLYMFLQTQTFVGLQVSVSDDAGTTWTKPVEVIKGDPQRKHWGLQTAMAVKDGWLYWANGRAYEEMGAVACDLRKGLLDPRAWISSNAVAMPLPKEIMSGTFSDGADGTMRCLEGNVVEVGGRLLIIARAVINRYGTSNMAAVFDLKREASTLDVTFRQLCSLPGGQCKFHILWDDRSQLFWMASNFPTNSWGLHHDPAIKLPSESTWWRSLREDRRILMLSYSLDALHWLPACCIAKAEKITQSFMYPSMVIDGDDIALLSRTSRNSNDYHDADTATFHRVRNFRSLAMDIRPQM